MATMEEKQAAFITVPADYLEDVRYALVTEIESDSQALTTNQAELLGEDCAFRRTDRDSAAGTLREDMHLLERLLEASGDATVRGEASALAHALEATVRVLSGRLTDVCQYGPLPMGDVVELSARLRWAADEAIRLWPDLARRLSDDEAVA